MPTRKIKGYCFYFKIGEVLEKNKGIHTHVKTSRGKIDYWIEKNGKKAKYKVEVKRIKGVVHDHEKNEIEKIIIKEEIDLFAEWEKAVERSKK